MDTNIDVRELKVELRKDTGKSVARKLRRKGQIPAVFYGTRHAPLPVTLSPEEMVEALNTPKLKNTLIKIKSASAELEGRTVMIKDIQRHPTSRAFLHVDLIEVYEDLPVKAMIPILTRGIPKGIDFGGTLEQPMRFVEIRCPATKIPANITIDVTELGVGDNIRLAQLPLSEGVELVDNPQATVVSIVAHKMEVEAAAEVVEGEEGAVPAEGAAAAGAAAPGAEGAAAGKKEGAGAAGAKKEAAAPAGKKEAGGKKEK